MNLKIMSFNLRCDTADDGPNAWPCRFHRVVETIRRAQPHVIGSQEGLRHMLEDLARELPEYGYVGTGREGETDGEHCAIWYKTSEIEIVDKGQFWLSEQPHRPGSKSWDSSLPRICTWAHMRSLHGSPRPEWFVYNTHLDHVGPIAREKGIALIWNSLREQTEATKLPALLTGDLNAFPDSSVVRFLRGEIELEGQRAKLFDAYALLGPSVGSTFHGFRGGSEGQPIDYMFASPGAVFLSVEIDRNLADGGYPSDHYPVIAEVRL